MAATRAIVKNVPMIRPRVVRSLTAGPGRRNEDSRAARPGSSAASRRSISASMRCSSIDSAIAPYLRVPRAGGNSLTIPHGGSFIQSFLVCARLFLHHGSIDYPPCSHQHHRVILVSAAREDTELVFAMIE